MQLQKCLKKYHNDLPSKDVRLITQKILGIPSDEWAFSQEKMLNEGEQKILEGFLQRRQAGEPVARLFEEWEFWGLSFHISKDTLVPRPDTETLIEAVLKRYRQHPPRTILDLGTGSGCILISLLSEFPDSFGIGVDLSKDAVVTARKNAIHNNVFRRCEFIQSDWSDAIQGTFDLIVSNPPYIESDLIESLAPEVRNHDPILALDGGEDGLESIEILLKKIKSSFSETGTAYFEIGHDQADRVMKLIEVFGFSTNEIHKDLAGHRRVIEFTCGDKNKKNESQA
jgi:release factor glutamine methyltransferase